MSRFFLTIKELLLEKKRATVDRSLIIIFPIVASVLSIIFSANALTGIVFFLIIPCLYMSYRYPLGVRRSTQFALVFGVPFIILIDYMAHVSHTWLVPSTVFPFRLFEVVTIESVIWGFAYVYYVVIYYEAFFDHHINQRPAYDRLKSLFYFMILIVAAFLFIYVREKSLLVIPFFYLLLGLVVILPPVVWMCTKSKRLTAKFVKTGAYFSFLNTLYEFTALELNHWSFPANGEFIGHFSLLHFTFPLEELIVWIFLSAVGILSYFEIFDNKST